MEDESKLKLQYIVEGGVLDGTVLEPVLATMTVKYPHRKTKDLYVPPLKKKVKWHCCQECEQPDFSTKNLMQHLRLHAGRLLKIRKATPDRR